ncbi:hypothetical protein TIFTF001_007408 [Ficus carica]|uniref:Transmembrane protein n=1 Tax=Ficus carica TaxID=3494 RepID=A0AA87ZRN1_FICCA|nr:hypothetical protein TIFTF001_007408 [Ficus carica]
MATSLRERAPFCVCVCERERERERESAFAHKTHRKGNAFDETSTSRKKGFEFGSNGVNFRCFKVPQSPRIGIEARVVLWFIAFFFFFTGS